MAIKLSGKKNVKLDEDQYVAKEASEIGKLCHILLNKYKFYNLEQKGYSHTRYEFTIDNYKRAVNPPTLLAKELVQCFFT